MDFCRAVVVLLSIVEQVPAPPISVHHFVGETASKLGGGNVGTLGYERTTYNLSFAITRTSGETGIGRHSPIIVGSRLLRHTHEEDLSTMK